VSAVTWAVRLVLALVFAVAGIAKLMDRDGARRTAAGLGVPVEVVPAVALAVSVLEIAIAVVLLFDRPAAAAALAAAALLAVFFVALGTQLARGVRVPCACFGRMTTAPAGYPALARNAALIAAAVFVYARLR
jgi:uncharacterized membrane protein YphA (DoxX/SURF4 family)